MVGCPSRAELRQYVTRDNSLGPDQVAQLESHIEECAACQDELDRITADDVPAGTTLPDLGPHGYRVYKLLGTGAFGEVWLAQDLNLPRVVALKTLKLGEDRDQRAIALEALRREAQLLTGIEHPNVVRVFAWITVRDQHYLVLQYVSGGSLYDMLKEEGPLDWQRAARYVADVGEGLLAVHAQGIVHRDVKPSNILWDRGRDEAMLTDFGIGARLGDPTAIKGSLPYMAPEAFDGDVSASLDVYSLAATLFHLVSGALPFPGPKLADFRDQAALGLPDPDVRCHRLPRPLEQVIRAGLPANPDHRLGLREFVASLRGSLNQLLADTLTHAPGATSGTASVSLRLQVSRDAGAGRYEPVATTHTQPGLVTRDMKRVPPAPDQVRLRTGDRVRVDVVADRAGYLAVFNVGPTGVLNLLYPADLSSHAASRVEAHQLLHIVDVEMTPPAGRERLFAVWSRDPLPLSTHQLQSISGLGEPAKSRPYRATRDMRRMQHTVQQCPEGGQSVVVLELEHGVQ